MLRGNESRSQASLAEEWKRDERGEIERSGGERREEERGERSGRERRDREEWKREER